MSSPIDGFTVDLGGSPLVLKCPPGLNTSEHHYVMQTALHDIVAWASTGVAPRSVPGLEVDASTTPPSYKLDGNGNVQGGLRTPAVDTPVATLSGIAVPDAPGFCIFFGQTRPLTAAQSAALYPTHDDFVRKWQQAVADDAAAGYLLPPDAARLKDVVTASS